MGPRSRRIRRSHSKHPLITISNRICEVYVTNQLKLNDNTETVIAKLHRTCLFTSSKITLELRQGSEDIIDMIIMTLVWVTWRQRLRMFTMVPTVAMLL